MSLLHTLTQTHTHAQGKKEEKESGHYVKVKSMLINLIAVIRIFEHQVIYF